MPGRRNPQAGRAQARQTTKVMRPQVKPRQTARKASPKSLPQTGRSRANPQSRRRS